MCEGAKKKIDLIANITEAFLVCIPTEISNDEFYEFN